MSPISIHLAENESDIIGCLPVLRELRPNLTPKSFVSTIRRMQTEGYFLVMLEMKRKVAAVAGYRFSEHLARGKFLYIDDFVTAEAERRNGYGKNLFDWLLKKAEDAGCSSVHLDSGVQRTEAHLFYEEQKMNFSSRHYSLVLKSA